MSRLVGQNCNLQIYRPTTQCINTQYDQKPDSLSCAMVLLGYVLISLSFEKDLLVLV